MTEEKGHVLDPLIDEVRRTRERLVREHGGLRGWFEHLRELQKEHAVKVIPPPKHARQ